MDWTGNGLQSLDCGRSSGVTQKIDHTERSNLDTTMIETLKVNELLACSNISKWRWLLTY